MERYKGYWITGSAVPGPPYTRYWETLGTVLKDGHSGSLSKSNGFETMGMSVHPRLLFTFQNASVTAHARALNLLPGRSSYPNARATL